MVDYQKYRTILVIDTNVILEGNPLSQQPWKDIDDIGPILILILPQVQREADRRKRDGRLAERSRAFNRLIGPAAENQSVIEISNGQPLVELGMAVCDRIDWTSIELDRDDGDHLIIAQILNLRGVDRKQIVFISQDINPIHLAVQHGIKIYRLPESWLLPPELNAKEKENQKLKSEIKLLQATEPQMSVEIEFDTTELSQVYRVCRLTGNLQYNLIRAAITKHPPPSRSSFLGGVDLSALGMGNEVSEEEYQKYETITLPLYAEKLNENLQDLFNQISFKVLIKNVGTVSASNLIVEIRSEGAKFNERFYFPDVFFPKPPKRRNSLIPAFHAPFSLRDNFSGRHEMVFDARPKLGNYAELHCQDFRHGREWVFEGFAMIAPNTPCRFQLDIRITAANMHGDYHHSAHIDSNAVDCEVTDLFSIKEYKLKSAFPLRKRYLISLKENNTDWTERPGDEED